MHHVGTVLQHSLSVILVAFMEAYAISKKYSTSEGYPLRVNQVRAWGLGLHQSRA